MAAKRTTKRTTKKTAARGAKKKPAAKKAAPKKAAPKKAAAKKAPSKKVAKVAARAKKPATKAVVAKRPAAAPSQSPQAPNNYPRFVWFDMMTPDVAASKSFYTSLMGWATKDAPIPGQSGTYTILNANGQDFGGVAALPDPKQPPAWMPYILVDNVEDTVREAERLGGSILMQPMEIPTVGRFAVVRDPTGAVFSPMSFVQPAGPPRDPPNLFGPVAWMDIMADEPERALAFYEGLFGWERVVKEDPAFGKFYEWQHGGRTVGGAYGRPPFIPANTWLTYFEVFDLNSAFQKAVDAGSKVLLPPTVAPGIGATAWLLDPQGTLYALLENAK